MRIAAMFTALTVLLVTAPDALAQCQSDADCRGARKCIDGQCQTPKCGKDVDCPEGHICDKGACITESQPSSTPPTLVPPPPRRTPPPRYTPQPVPPSKLRTEVVYETRKGLWITGVCLFSATYIPSALFGIEIPEARSMVIPLVGPWMQAAKEADNDAPAPVGSLLVFDGLAQIAGMTLLIVGLATKRKITRRVYTQNLPEEDDGPLIMAVPSTLGGTGFGASLSIINF